MNLPPWQGLRVLVTGATNGIGELLVQRLCRDGAQVTLHGRSAEKVAAVVTSCGKNARGVVADLSSLEDVERLGRETEDTQVLINNAGIGFGQDRTRREVSRDGFELRFAVNYLAPFVLTHALLRRAKLAAIVNVASAGQEPVDLEDLQLTRSYDGMSAYRRSKLALVMFSLDTATAFPSVPVDSLHPGTFLDTGMVREAGIHALGPASQGVESVLHVLEEALVGSVTGRYFDQTQVASPNAQARDVDVRRRLREKTAALLGSRPFTPAF